MVLLDDEEARRTRRRATWTVVGVGTALVVVLAMVAAFVISSAGGGKVRGTAPAVPTTIVRSPGPATKSSAPTLGAGNVSWSDFHGTAVPVSSAGPHNTDGGRASGFDHSADGAVLAAIHIGYRVESSVGPKVFESTINDQMVGLDKELYTNNVEAEYRKNSALGPLGPNGEITADFQRAQQERSGVWGYRVDSYADDTAFVQVLLRTTSSGSAVPTYVNVGYTLKWVQGDWRITAPPQGDWKNVSRVLPNPPVDYVALGRG